MDSEPLDELFEKLSTGDPAACEKLFRTYEPYLRMVVRRQLTGRFRAKFDSIDVVQSVWADVFDGFRGGKWRFQDAGHLRAFLVRVTRNRFIDRLRQNQAAVAAEDSLALMDVDQLTPSHSSRPSEMAMGDELWRMMLAHCPPQHRELLNLKRQGLSLSEIAERTGLHQSSVRRVIYDLARRMTTTSNA